MTRRVQGGRDEVGRAGVAEGEERVGDMWRGRDGDGTRLLQRSTLKRGSHKTLSAFICTLYQTAIYADICIQYVHMCNENACVVNAIISLTLCSEKLLLNNTIILTAAHYRLAQGVYVLRTRVLLLSAPHCSMNKSIAMKEPTVSEMVVCYCSSQLYLSLQYCIIMYSCILTFTPQLTVLSDWCPGMTLMHTVPHVWHPLPSRGGRESQRQPAGR